MPALAVDIGYLEDPTQDLGLKEVHERSAAFLPFDEFEWDEAANEIVVWMRIAVENPTKSELIRYLNARRGHYWKASFYVTDTAGAPVRTQHYNAVAAAADPNELTASVAFPFSLPAESKRLLYLRVKTYDIRGVHLTLRSHEAQLRAVAVDRIATGMLLGALLGLIAYNAVIFSSLRERAFWLYFAFLVSSTIYVLATRRIGTGLAAQHLGLWPQDLTSLFALISLVFVTLFTRSFLRTAATMPRVHMLLTGLIILSPAILVVDVLGVQNWIDAHGLFVFASLASLLAAGVVGIVRRQRDAFLYACSMIFFLTGALLSHLYDLGFRPYVATHLVVDAAQYGLVLCLVLLAASISSRINAVHAERVRLRESDRAKTQLLGTVSHELRTPLANLTLQIEQLTDNGSNDAIVTSMKRQTARLATHVENLLIHSRFALLAKPPQYRRTDMIALTSALVEDFCLRAAEVDLTLTGPTQGEPIWSEVDTDLITSALGNLIDNALRATPAGGEVTISLVALGEVHGNGQDGPRNNLTIQVRDTGPGVPSEYLESIFEGACRSSVHGLGLGLPLAAQIVRAHGGTIDYEFDGGAVFTMRLPMHSAVGTDATDASAVAAPAETPDTLRGCRDQDALSSTAVSEALDFASAVVLVVDDDGDLREGLRSLLSRRFNVTAVNGGASALDMLSHTSVDAIVCDVMMPGVDGFELLQRVRQSQRHRSVPFVFLTARADHETELHALSHGAVDFVRKPFHIEVLTAKLTSLISSRRALEERLRSALLEHVASWSDTQLATPPSRPTFDLESIRMTYGLTDRQTEVLNLVMKGYTNREIASLLKLSVKTVNYHVSAVLKRVGVERRTQLSHELNS
ncbi:MAG: response regulator [Spirochaetes bacterium]|jgi:DNA-binding NarL/FixJ family response regulator/signal transduction histidine kinase|nr:response regulator [Spirochaetota bacterium]